MRLGADASGDYHEKKEELDEQIEELEEIRDLIQKFEGQFNHFKDNRD